MLSISSKNESKAWLWSSIVFLSDGVTFVGMWKCRASDQCANSKSEKFKEQQSRKKKLLGMDSLEASGGVCGGLKEALCIALAGAVGYTARVELAVHMHRLGKGSFLQF